MRPLTARSLFSRRRRLSPTAAPAQLLPVRQWSIVLSLHHCTTGGASWGTVPPPGVGTSTEGCSARRFQGVTNGAHNKLGTPTRSATATTRQYRTASGAAGRTEQPASVEHQ